MVSTWCRAQSVHVPPCCKPGSPSQISITHPCLIRDSRRGPATLSERGRKIFTAGVHFVYWPSCSGVAERSKRPLLVRISSLLVSFGPLDASRLRQLIALIQQPECCLYSRPSVFRANTRLLMHQWFEQCEANEETSADLPCATRTAVRSLLMRACSSADIQFSTITHSEAVGSDEKPLTHFCTVGPEMNPARALSA